jgi:hypothetical protein
LADKLGEAFFAVRASQQQLASDLSGIKGLVQTSLTGLVAGAGAITAGIGGVVFGGFIEKALSAEEAMIRLEAAIEGSGGVAGYTKDQIVALAKNISDTTIFAKGAAISAAQLMLSFSSIRGDTFERAMNQAAGLATMMETDLPTAARTLGMALENPEQGMQRLRRAGILLTESQKQHIKALQESGDLQGAQAALLDVIATKTGPVAAAMRNSLSGQLQVIKNDVGQMQKSIGIALLPALEAAMPAAKALVAAVADNKDMFAAMGQVVAGVFSVFTAVVTGALNLWKGLPAGIKEAVGSLIAMVAGVTAVGTAWAILAPAVGVVGGALSVLLGPIGLIAAGLTLVGAAFTSAFKDADLGPRMSAAWAEIKDTVLAVWQALTSGEDTINSVGSLWDWMKGQITTAFEAAAHWIGENKGTLVSWAATIRSTVIGAINEVIFIWETLGLQAERVWTGIALAGVTAADFLTDALYGFLAVCEGLWGALAGGFAALWENIKGGAETLGAVFMATFKAAGAALSAAFTPGKSAADEFTKTFSQELQTRLKDVGKGANVGDAVAEGWTKGFESGISRYNIGESEIAKQLSKDLDGINSQLDEQRQKLDANRQAAQAVGPAVGAAAAAAGGPGHGPGAPRESTGGKVETVGAVELYKKIQDSITGGGMADSAKATAENTDKTARGTEVMVKQLDEVIKKLDTPPIPLAG